MNKKPTQAGRIGNQGAQKVEAVFPQKKGKAPVKKTGDDLRNGGKK